MNDKQRLEAVEKAAAELLNLMAGLKKNGQPGNDPEPAAGLKKNGQPGNDPEPATSGS